MPDKPDFYHGFENKPKTGLKLKLSARVKLASLLTQSERDFYLRIKSIEASQLFMKLFSPENRAQRVIAYARPGRLKLSGRFLEIKDDILPGGGRIDVEPILLRRKKAGQLIKEIGEENFKKHFLLNDAGIDDEEIARKCAIAPGDVREIVALVNEISSREEFYDNSGLAPEKSVIYNKIACIENDGGGFAIAYYMPHLAKGRYSIDYEKIEEQKKRGVYSREDAKEIDALVKQLEVINIRRTVTRALLEEIIEFQKEFLKSGRMSRLVPLSQKQVARRLRVNPSIVNRALHARSVAIPTGKEVPLKEFFPSKKDVVKNMMKDELSGGKGRLNDNELSRVLLDKYGYGVSRHLVQIYRKELGIRPAGKNG